AAVLLVAIGALAGGIYDWRAVHMQRQAMKAAANSAALEGARALNYPENNAERLDFAANAHVASRLTGAAFDTGTEIDRQQSTLQVDISAPARVRFPGPLSLVSTVSVSARAELVTAGPDLCALAISDERTGARGTVRVGAGAKLLAKGCAIHSDRARADAIQLAKTASVVTAAQYRAAGDDQSSAGTGAQGARLVAERGDPLQARLPVPDATDECDHVDRVVTGHETLSAGVYCGGLVIDGGRAELYAGTYVIKDGPLKVVGEGRLKGEFVGFQLVGPDAVLDFDPRSDVRLSAPRTGEMAGLLVRGVQPTPGEDGDRTPMRHHLVASENAHLLTGTMYLPGDRLDFGGGDRIADQSAFTLVVAGELEVLDGATLRLNSAYDDSDIPVPAGLGPINEVTATLVSTPAS
ncbi:MAG: hypothetical protein AAF253_14340, partial [Pseudomonadota bacterium]